MNPGDKLNQFRSSLDRQKLTEKAVEKWHWMALSGIFLLAFLLRYAPEQGMQYLQAADPYMIFRMSQHIALEGNLPQLDFSRYFPYATPTYVMNQGDFIIPVLLYKTGFGLFFENFLEWAQFYPAFLGALTTVPMYFFGKEIFNRKAGISAAFFLAVTSGALRRTSTGFFEKEPLGTFLMVLGLAFFTISWKRTNWIYGILSGLSLGLFTISWGGVDIMYYVYPMIIGALLFLNEETRSMVAAYTPTVLLGVFIGSILNPARFWFTSNLVLINLGMLGLLWFRYLAEEFELVDREYLPYFVPTTAALGGVMALLSPLYSNFIASKVIGLFLRVFNTGGGVIAGTVQENAPPGAGSLVTSLTPATGVQPVNLLLASTGAWTLAMIAVPLMLTSLLLMAARKYSLISEISGKKRWAYIHVVTVSWMVFMSALLQNSMFIGLLGSVVVGSSLLAVVYFVDRDSALSISSMSLGAAITALIIYSLRFSGAIISPLMMLTLLPVLLVALTTLVVYKFDYFPQPEIEMNWALFIPLTWIITLIYGGTTRSRLVFLSAFGISLAAGYTFSKAFEGLREIDYSEIGFIDVENLKIAVTLALVLFVASMNVLAGVQTSTGLGIPNSEGIRGSPSPSPQIWEQSVDFMQEAPEGSVTLSWWDYGYLFQTLGRTGSVADGGNFAYYTDEEKINFPLASYLNSTVENDTEFIDKHSADYVWLDYSMIGKFSAVSQIANRDNSQFEVISSFRTNNLRNSLSSDGDQTVAEFRGRFGRGTASVFTPLDISNSSVSTGGAPTVRFSGGQSTRVDCVLTEDGRQDYDVDSSLPYCLAEDPFYSYERGLSGGASGVVLVPKKIADSTFVKLYIQDGHGVPYAEKVPEASNGYIKMWEITE